MPLTKAEQVAEAEARTAAGTESSQTADAIDVVDDGARGAPPEPARTQPSTEEPQRPAPIVKSKFDDRRNEIVARFRTDRGASDEENRDEISDFARSGLPPEFAAPPLAPAAEPEPQEQEPAVEAEPAPPAAPQTFKVKVHGQEKELTLEEITAHAQKSLAADNILEEAKTRFKELDGIVEQARHKVARPDQPANTTPADRTQTTEHVPTDGAVHEHHEDPIAKLIETLQFGDPAEAATLLQNTIAEQVGKGVTTGLQVQRLQDEGARSNKVLEDFKAAHADLAADPLANAAIERQLFELQIEDLKAIGIDPDKLPTPTGRVTPGDIAQAHLWYRSQGFQMRKPQEMLETATAKFLEWKGVAKKETPADTATRAAPRVDVTVDRTARRAAIPQQPSRTVSPRPDAQQVAAQPRDRSEIVRQEQQRRNARRGIVGVA